MLYGKNTPLLKDLQQDKFVKVMLDDRNKRFTDGNNCQTTDCLINAFKWNEHEISTLEQAFQKLYDQKRNFRSFLEKDIIASH